MKEEIYVDGIKHDAGKPMMDILPWDALVEVAKIMTFGADKYEVDNWKKVKDPKRYEAAMLRHYSAVKMGEDLDSETGLHHFSHMACNALFLLHFALEEQKKIGKSISSQRLQEN